MTPRTQWTAWILLVTLALSGSACAAEQSPTTIRTEAYPRPPYSEATYYVYERNGEVICTKLAVCDKSDQCDTDYHAGTFLDPQDQKAGKPYHVTAAVPIPPGKLGRHQCLVRFVPNTP